MKILRKTYFSQGHKMAREFILQSKTRPDITGKNLDSQPHFSQFITV